jgi:Bacterial RNA polymerase, alpha chain C terminal domain
MTAVVYPTAGVGRPDRLSEITGSGHAMTTWWRPEGYNPRRQQPRTQNPDLLLHVAILWPRRWPERTRIVNALLRSRVTTIGELCGHSPRELLRLPGIGVQAVGECNRALRERGLCLRGEEPTS